MPAELDPDAGLAELNPELLEQLRRGFPLHMDRQGNLRLDGDPITHPGVLRVLRDNLDVTERGEVTVGVAGKWVYLKLDDLPLRALRIDKPRGDETMPALLLDDGRRLTLDPATLWEEPGAGLRCTVPARGSGRALGVRFGNAAMVDLSEYFVWEDEDGRPQLQIGGRRWPIPERSP